MIWNLLASFLILCTMVQILRIIWLCMDIKARFDEDPLRRYDNPPPDPD